jgi:hypothetical protein
MPFLPATLARRVFGPAPELLCDQDLWAAGVAELAHRTYGYRESGAFLLGRKDARRTIEKFIFYDDIDPHALDSGIVVIDGRRLGALWSLCRSANLEVVADVHVHPGGYGQSPSDKANPVIAEVGHMAFILPHYAARNPRPGRIGVYQYLGGRRWRDRSREFFSPLHVGWWPWR